MIKKGDLDNLVIGRTMETIDVQLIGIGVIKRQMLIAVMSSQRVDSDFRSDAQRKQRQHHSC